VGINSLESEKVKTLQDSNTKALLTTVGQLYEKFIKGIYPVKRSGGVGEWGSEGVRE
jgi:hypothetical protein